LNFIPFGTGEIIFWFFTVPGGIGKAGLQFTFQARRLETPLTAEP